MKLSRLLLVAGAAAVAITGAWNATAVAQERQKIKLALHWNAPTHEFVQYYAAMKLGFYKEQNLDVELLALPGSVPAAVSVSTGDAQIGQASSDAILVSMGGGASLKTVFVLFQQTPAGVIVFQNSGIKTFAGLRGKTISTSVASPEGIMLNARLRQAGVDPTSDLRLLNVAPGAKLTMQLTGQSDASTGFLDFQYIQAQMAGRQVDFLPFSTKAEPLYGHAIFVNGPWFEKNPDATRRFLAATVRGLVWARANVDKAVEMVVTWDTSVKVDPAFSKRGWEVEISDLITNSFTAEKGIGHMQTAGWANLVTMLKDGGILKATIDPDKIFTNDYIPKDAPKW